MLISILRTIVPALWGSFIVWLLGVVPVLEPLRADLLAYGDLAVPVISAVIIGAWYAFWRWLEPRLPDWLTRILLGSAKVPVYAPDQYIGISQESIDRALGSIQRARDGRHEAITQPYTDDTNVHSDECDEYPIGELAGPTQADPERYTQ